MRWKVIIEFLREHNLATTGMGGVNVPIDNVLQWQNVLQWYSAYHKSFYCENNYPVSTQAQQGIEWWVYLSVCLSVSQTVDARMSIFEQIRKACSFFLQHNYVIISNKWKSNNTCFINNNHTKSCEKQGFFALRPNYQTKHHLGFNISYCCLQ